MGLFSPFGNKMYTIFGSACICALRSQRVMQLFQVEYCEMYPTIHLYFLEYTNDWWDIPMHTMRKGCMTILIGCIFYDQGMKQINSCLIGRYKLSHNFYFNYSSWEWFFSLIFSRRCHLMSSLVCSFINTEGLFS